MSLYCTNIDVYFDIDNVLKDMHNDNLRHLNFGNLREFVFIVLFVSWLLYRLSPQSSVSKELLRPLNSSLNTRCCRRVSEQRGDVTSLSYFVAVWQNCLQWTNMRCTVQTFYILWLYMMKLPSLIPWKKTHRSNISVFVLFFLKPFRKSNLALSWGAFLHALK